MSMDNKYISRVFCGSGRFFGAKRSVQFCLLDHQCVHSWITRELHRYFWDPRQPHLPPPGGTSCWKLHRQPVRSNGRVHQRTPVQQFESVGRLGAMQAVHNCSVPCEVERKSCAFAAHHNNWGVNAWRTPTSYITLGLRSVRSAMTNSASGRSRTMSIVMVLKLAILSERTTE